jgi:VWFA-related protein
MRLTFLSTFLAAISLFAGTGPQTPQPDEPLSEPSVTFRSDVSLVRVDAQVVDGRNHPIKGLTPDDFVLRINGERQDIKKLVTEKLPVDLILLLDVSRSMQPHVERVASAAHQALGVLGDQDRIAILVFDRGTRVRMPFGNSREEAETALQRVVDNESFEGGTDITKALLDASNYMARNARPEARRAIVILTDDQTELDRDEAGVQRALERSNSVLSALIAPDALHTGTRRRSPFGDGFMEELERRGMLPPEFKDFARDMTAPRTRSAGTADIARQSGGDSMPVDGASAFQETLARIRERYGLFFYLPEDAKPGDEKKVQLELSDAARQKFPDAEVRYRNSSTAPGSESGVRGSKTDWI